MSATENAVESGEDLFDPQSLVDYLNTQLTAAQQKERAMYSYSGPFSNGTFIRSNAIPGADEQVPLATTLVMRRPFSSLLRLVQGEFAEIYRVQVAGADERAGGQFLVRRFESGQYCPLELITPGGVFPVDVKEFNPAQGFNVDAKSGGSLEDELNRAREGIERAEELYALLSRYNIVPVTD